MIQRLIQARRKFALLCVLLAALSICTPLFAQLDYDTYDIFQNGINVGVIYVPVRGADPSVYAEYWIMSDRYQYPSEKNPVATTIKSSRDRHYTSLTDFLTNAPWAEGYHFLTVEAYDRTTRPVPAAIATE